MDQPSPELLVMRAPLARQNPRHCSQRAKGCKRMLDWKAAADALTRQSAAAIS
jgi:hypothetical protein